MTLQEFINKWQGKPVDVDGVYPNQCMDLMHKYHMEVLGLNDRTILSAPAAKDVYLKYPNVKGGDRFTQIANTPSNSPSPGDIVFWGTAIGQYGHVAICVSSNVNSLTTFDANWPVGSLPHIQNHTYKGVLGWLRFKQPEPPKPAPQPEPPKEQPKQEDPMLDHVDAFKNIFIANYGSWPTDDQVNEYRNAGGLPYTFFQNRYLYPDQQRKDQEWNDRLNALQTQINDLNTKVTSAETEKSNIISQIEGFKQRIEEQNTLIVRKNKKILNLENQPAPDLSEQLQTATIWQLLAAAIDKLF